MKNQALLMTILVIMVGAGSFFAGMKYQQGKGFSRIEMQSGGMHGGMIGQRGEGEDRRRNGPGMITGEIISKDETSITVKQADDSTKIVLFSESAGVHKAVDGTIEDLKTGERVMVFGQENPDGSITANSIQIGRLRGQ